MNERDVEAKARDLYRRVVESWGSDPSEFHEAALDYVARTIFRDVVAAAASERPAIRLFSNVIDGAAVAIQNQSRREVELEMHGDRTIHVCQPDAVILIKLASKEVEAGI